MLQPKRTKFRKQHKGRIHGEAKGGFLLNFGSFGLKSTEPEASKSPETVTVSKAAWDDAQARLGRLEADAAAKRQAEVIAELGERIGGGEKGISGLMVESFIEAGAQSVEAAELVYGQSVTDACIGWDTTEQSLRALAEAVRRARVA